MTTKQEQLEAELLAARTDLARSVEALTERLSPKAQLHDLTDGLKHAASDAAGIFRGKGVPKDAHRTRNLTLLLGATAIVVALGARLALRRH